MFFARFKLSGLLLLFIVTAHAAPLPFDWSPMQRRETSDTLCGLGLREGAAGHRLMCEDNNNAADSFMFDDYGNFVRNYIPRVTSAFNCDHVLELHFLSDLMREGVKRLDTSMDDLCERMSKLKKNGRPYGLAQRLKDIIEAEDNLFYMPAEVNKAKYLIMAGVSTKSVADVRTLPAVAFVLRERKDKIANTANRIASLLNSRTGEGDLDTDRILDNPFPALTEDWKTNLSDRIEKIVNDKRYAQPDRLGPPPPCVSESQETSAEPHDDRRKDANFKGKESAVPPSDRVTRSRAKLGKRANAATCTAPSSSNSTAIFRSASNGAASLSSTSASPHTSSSLSRTSLAVPTATLSSARVGGLSGNATHAQPLAASHSSDVSTPSARLAASSLAGSATASRSVKATTTAALPLAPTRAALPPVRNTPIAQATPKPQLAPSAKLPSLVKPASGTRPPSGALPRIAKPLKISPARP